MRPAGKNRLTTASTLGVDFLRPRGWTAAVWTARIWRARIWRAEIWTAGIWTCGIWTAGVSCLGLLCISAVFLGCGGSSASSQPKNVLIVSLDTLRADRLGSYGYARAQTPHLDALANRGLRFEKATTVAPLTLPAHSSLMTGTFPATHGVLDNGGYYLEEQATTLAELLHAEGFRTGGFVGAFVLDSRWGIAQGFDRFFDDFDLTDFEGARGMDAIQWRGDRVVDQAIDWLGQLAGEPFFAWVHLYDPHTPYDAPEPYRSRFEATRSGAYDAEIAATDAEVGRLLDDLDRAGRLDETLIVVLSDHGELLGEHDEITHGFFLYEGAVRIPLLIAGPGLPQTVVPDQVRIVDVLPTVLKQLGLEVPDTVQGVDLTPFATGEGERLLGHSVSWFPRLHYGWSELSSIQDERYKLIRAPRPELYDLTVDAAELNNLADREPERVASMNEALSRLLERYARDETAAPQPLDEETARGLRALGYLAGSSASRHLDDRDRQGQPLATESRSDPKDMIGLYTRMKEAAAAAADSEIETGIAKVKEVLVEDPEIVEAYLLLGNFETQRQRLDAAAEAYREALALDSEYQEAIYSLAVTYKKLGLLDEALAGLERAATLDPRNGKVLWEAADTLMQLQRFDDAETHLLAALDLDLDRPRFLLKLASCYFEQQRLGEAERHLREALQEKPELQLAQYTLGLILEEQGRVDEAITAYRSELELDPSAFRARFNLAKLLLAAGHKRDAAQAFRATIDAQPEFGTGYLYLAKVLLDLGDLEAAERNARLGLERQPHQEIAPLAHYVLADVYTRRGQTVDAEREIAAAQRLEPTATGAKARAGRDPS